MALTIKNQELEAHVTENARAEGISADEYLERLIAEDKRRLESLRTDVHAGFNSIDRGDYVDYSSGDLAELFSEVESEGLKRLALRQTDR